MPHPMMTACGLSSLHRYKFKKVLGKMKSMKGGSAQRKGAGLSETKQQMTPSVMSSHMPKRTLQFR